MNTRKFNWARLIIGVLIIVIVATLANQSVTRAARREARLERDAALRTQVVALRKAIERYTADHDGKLPGADGSSKTFWRDLVDKVGGCDHINRPNAPYYVRRAMLVVGPNAGAKGVIMTTASPCSSAIDESQTTCGWVFNYETAEFIVNTDDLDEHGVAYSAY